MESILNIIKQKFSTQIELSFESHDNPFCMFKKNNVFLFKMHLTNDYALYREIKESKTGLQVCIIELFRSDWKNLEDIESDYLRTCLTFKVNEQQASVVISCLS